MLYDGEEIIEDLRTELERLTEGSAVEILRIRNNRIVARVLGEMAEGERLDDLDVREVFMRCLDRHEVSETERPELLSLYGEILTTLDEEDPMAEESA